MLLSRFARYGRIPLVYKVSSAGIHARVLTKSRPPVGVNRRFAPLAVTMLKIEDSGSGDPLVLLHGLTATRRYVLQGSRLLAREGFRVVAYDARGHGESGPAPSPGAYEYADLAADLVAVLDGRGIDRAVLIGHSMGAATAIRLALEAPERVAGLVQITPAYAGSAYGDESTLADGTYGGDSARARGMYAGDLAPADGSYAGDSAPARAGGASSGASTLAYWDRLAAGLAAGGVDGFMRAFEPPADPRWREPVLKFTRQRLERHLHPEALVDALRVVPRSEAFAGLDLLGEVAAPALVVGSRDEADPTHPLAVAREYARRLPRAELALEAAGEPPLAWQGAQLSRAVLDWLRRLDPRW
jgi:3-oxoadipate enol-lactonase